jgi:hypothetical protein
MSQCLPKLGLSGRILTLIILCWGFLVCCSYNAILTSVLAVAKEPTPIRNFEELLHSKRYTPLLRSNGAVKRYFENSPASSTGVYD